MTDRTLEAVRDALSRPMRVKVTLERDDGTEVMHTYPLGAQTVKYGQTVHLEFKVNVETS